MQSQNENKISELLERLILSYSSYFDISRDKEILGNVVPALAEFHSRAERYVMVKKANIWAVENHEYVFFFTEPDLTPYRLLEIFELLTRAEKELVKPHSEHMYSYISGIILAERVKDPLPQLIRKIKFRKNYKLSLHGWCHVRMVLTDVTDNRIWTNKDGADIKKNLKKIYEL